MASTTALVLVSVQSFLTLCAALLVLERLPRATCAVARGRAHELTEPRVQPTHRDEALAPPVPLPSSGFDDLLFGPKEDLVYQLTRVGTSYGRGYPDGRRTTWRLALHPSGASATVVREALDDHVFLNADVHARAWRQVGSSTYVGTCQALDGGRCLDESGSRPKVANDLRILWKPASAYGEVGDEPRAIVWRCTRSVAAALTSSARFDHGGCTGEGGGSNAWVPALRRERITLRCDGERQTEPRIESPTDEPFVGHSAVLGLHFATGAGLEWIDEMQDCPVRGAFRDLPGAN